MLIDGPGLLALAVLVGAVVYYVFFREARLARRLKPLAEMLDAGTARLEDGCLNGEYSGRRVWLEYRAKTGSCPVMMRMGVACEVSFSFRIHKKAESLQPSERACIENLEEGSLQDVKSGDPLWDGELTLATQSEASFRRWINRPDAHEILSAIVLRPLTTIVLYDEDALWAVYPSASAEAVFQSRFARESLDELVSLSETMA